MQFEILGTADRGAPAIVVSAGLGGLGSFWRPQFEALTAQFRVVVYDHRGTGKNASPLPEDYTIGMMTDDVVEILDAADIDRCHFLGHALGGLVGLDLALRAPTRLSSLVLVNAWAKPNSHSARCFAVRRDLLKNSGVEAYVRAQPIFLYPAAWLEANADRAAKDEAAGIEHFQGNSNLLARIGALLEFDVADELAKITTPALVAAARDDVLVPWTCSQFLANHLPEAEVWMTVEGGHAFTVVEPYSFNEAIMKFLGERTKSTLL